MAMYPLQFDTESLFYDFIFPIHVTLSNETAQILYLFLFPYDSYLRFSKYLSQIKITANLNKLSCCPFELNVWSIVVSLMFIKLSY